MATVRGVNWRRRLYEHTANASPVIRPAAPRQSAFGYLSIKQVAMRWQVAERTVWRFIKSGRLPSIKIGKCRRISEDAARKIEMSGAQQIG